MKETYEMVREFHAACDEPIGLEPDHSPERIAARRNFISEEVDELIAAVDRMDIVEVFDALIDLHYFIEGSRLCFGWQSSFLKLSHVSGHSSVRAMNELVETLGKLIGYMGANRLFVSQFDEAETAVFSVANSLIVGDKKLIQCYLDGFREVHRSNMAKVGTDGKVIRNEIGKILKPEGWTPPNLKQFVE